MGEGPYWNYRVGQEAEFCGDTFWYFVAGVNNIFETNKAVRWVNFYAMLFTFILEIEVVFYKTNFFFFQCLYTSWYIAVDLQTAIVGDTLIYILNRKKSLGIFLTGALFLGSTIACSVVLFVNNYHSILQITDR